MRNAADWIETKFALTPAGLAAGPLVALSSRWNVTFAAPHFERMIRNHARGVLLDLGCGKAPLFGVYGRYADRVICVDWPRSAHGPEYMDFAADFNRGLALRDATVDTVLCTSVLEHIAEPAVFWNETVRVLRPGGKLLLGAPFFYSLHEQPHDYARYTRFWYERQCAAHDFRVISLEPYGGGLDVLAHVTAKVLARWRLPSRLLAAAVPRVLRFSALRRWNWGTADILPAGYCLVALKE
jgi:SAM-dependent methyltransferase